MVTLGAVMAQGEQALGLGGGFDAFGDGFDAEAAGQLQDCAGDDVGSAVGHEGTVEFDLDDRAGGEQRQSGLAGAEVVECDADAEGVQLGEGVGGCTASYSG